MMQRMRAQDGGRAARAALPPVSQSVEELKSIVASARYAPVPPPQPQHLSAAERCAVFLPTLVVDWCDFVAAASA